MKYFFPLLPVFFPPKSRKLWHTFSFWFLFIFIFHDCHVILTIPHSSTGGQCSPVKEMCGALILREACYSVAPLEQPTFSWKCCSGSRWVVWLLSSHWRHGRMETPGAFPHLKEWTFACTLSLMKRTKVSRAEVAARGLFFSLKSVLWNKPFSCQPCRSLWSSLPEAAAEWSRSAVCRLCSAFPPTWRGNLD